MKKVLFVSQNELERAENLRSVYEAYDGPKDFVVGQHNMLNAEVAGYSVVVCDALPSWIAFKDKCKSLVICHGMTGNKHYGLDEHREWADPEAYAQTDVATAASEGTVHLVAQQLGIPDSKVRAVGFPRTDRYVGAKKGDGGTFLAKRRAYLYVPTFRDDGLGGWLPRIDWEKVDEMLDDDEVFVLKRHYFTEKAFLGSDFRKIVEVDPQEPLIPYLIDCDAVLTDYSSVLSDAYLLDKACVLAVDDMDEYLADRGMYYQFPQAYCSRWLHAFGNEAALVAMMRDAAKKGLGEVEMAYRDLTAGMCDGHSAERTVELIRSLL